MSKYKSQSPSARRWPDVECICPMCSRLHKRKMEWTGAGTPRMYCPACSQRVSGVGRNFAVAHKGE